MFSLPATGEQGLYVGGFPLSRYSVQQDQARGLLFDGPPNYGVDFQQAVTIINRKIGTGMIDADSFDPVSVLVFGQYPKKRPHRIISSGPEVSL